MALVPAFVGTVGKVARASSEVQTTPPWLNLPVHVLPALTSQSLISDPWGCSVSGAIAQDVEIGSQIRVCRSSDHCAVYTVTEKRANDSADVIRLGKSGRQRLGTSDSGFSATLRQALATSKMTDSQAKSSGEFVERIQDTGNHQGLVVLAPHGGAIEINTDLQALRVADRLSGADVSTWCCKGWKPGGGAYDRWHVTSTEINPQSFPGLAKLAQRSYAYSVAFHGMGASGVLIGGAGPSQLKHMLRQAISAALGGAAGPVTIAKQGSALGGTSPDNVGNWLTAGGAGGIQLEQSNLVRTKYWRDVADAVASVYAGRL
jgi:phage replication-related protein YjqB (UPF0714/DUF867 family)